MSGKDNAANSLGTDHLAVCSEVGQLTFKLGFELVTPGLFTNSSIGKDFSVSKVLHNKALQLI